MLLSRDNRLTILETLPFHGEWKYYRVFRELREEVGFDNDEIAEWDEVGVKDFEIASTPKAELIRVLDELRALEKITSEQEALYSILTA